MSLRCEQCCKVIDAMCRIFYKMPDLRANYTKLIRQRFDLRSKFFRGCHVLRSPDLEAWIVLVLSKKHDYPDSFKRQINSLDYVPEPGLFQRLSDGERMFKKRKSACPQEDPPLIS